MTVNNCLKLVCAQTELEAEITNCLIKPVSPHTDLKIYGNILISSHSKCTSPLMSPLMSPLTSPLMSPLMCCL